MINVLLTQNIDLGKNYGFGKEEFSSPGRIISSFLPILFSIVGLAILFYIIFASFKLMNSGGNKEEIGKARTMLANGAIGILILIFSFALVQYLFEALGLKGFKIIK